MPKEKFTATLTIMSDWHIGSGAGRPGNVDRLIQRDQNNFPYVPAKTLTGIWRDACELLALGLDNGHLANWSRWVNYLFGDQPALAAGVIETPPQEAAFSIRAAYLAEELQQALDCKPKLKEALTFVKPGISIDPTSGCAKSDFLRYEEMVRGGATLFAECELKLPEQEEQRNTAYALLLAGTKLVERLGGKRRRGAGKCQLIVEENLMPWIEWLEKHPHPPEPPSLPGEKNTETLRNTGEEHSTQADDWLQLPITITAESPIVISKRTVGNVVESLDYIPGTHLLRLVCRKLSHLHVDLDRAIARGDLLLTNATVMLEGQPGRPMPFALFSQKLGGGLDKGFVYNRLREQEPKEHQLKAERQGYIGLTNSQNLPQHTKVSLTLETHNVIEDTVQRPNSDVGGVYSYEGIAAETQLQAHLRLRRYLVDALARQNKAWWQKLQGRDRLGQSKKDDYGLVSIKVAEELQSLLPRIEGITSELTVWLLSDLLLRDERLRPTASIETFAKKLGKALGIELKPKHTSSDDTLSVLARHHKLDSWQVRWGLPRPSLAGLAAGTCVVLEVQDGEIPDPVKLAQVQAMGIGERRSEGYGQLCFNDPLLTAPTCHLKPKNTSVDHNKKLSSNPSTTPIAQTNPVFSYARIIEKAAWREAIRRSVLRVAASVTERKQALGISINPKIPETPSQLGALRSVLARLQKPEDSQNVVAWLKHLRQTLNRKEKWSDESLETIENLVTDYSRIWTLLKIETTDLVITQTGEQQLQTELWAEAIRALADACIRAHQRELEPKDTTSPGTV